MFKPHRMECRSQKARAGTSDLFETTDFYLACYLRCGGFKLAGILRDGTRSVFRFKDRADREEVMLAFFNNEGSVRPLEYSAAIKDLKALIHKL